MTTFLILSFIAITIYGSYMRRVAREAAVTEMNELSVRELIVSGVSVKVLRSGELSAYGGGCASRSEVFIEETADGSMEDGLLMHELTHVKQKHVLIRDWVSDITGFIGVGLIPVYFYWLDSAWVAVGLVVIINLVNVLITLGVIQVTEILADAGIIEPESRKFRAEILTSFSTTVDPVNRALALQRAHLLNG